MNNANVEQKQLSTISNPLKLVWRQGGYYVNKPEDRTGEYVSKEVAEVLLAACVRCKELLDIAEIELPVLDMAISKATQP